MDCLSLMRDRFRKLIEKEGLKTNTNIANRFNDSIFQEQIEVVELH